MVEFVEVAHGAYVLRYPVLDVNTTLVVGENIALVVDTLSTAAQAVELAHKIRRITPHPLVLVNTHHHFDHCFGNATLTDGITCPIWGHQEAAAYLREHSATMAREVAEHYRADQPDFANEIAGVEIVPPNHTVLTESTVDIGGRTVVLRHLGRAHTAGDVVVHVPDADLMVAGDLVEESGPPDFADAYPLEWSDTLAALLALLRPATTVIPGHGAPVDCEFVATQHRQLTALEWLIREGHADGAPPEKVAASSPFGAASSLVAIRRGYATLSGQD